MDEHKLNTLTPIEIVLEEAKRAVSEGKITKEQYLKLETEFKEKQTNSPFRIAISGKSGVGKTTTLNSLFSADDFIMDVDNKAIWKRIVLKNGAILDIIDMPELGDDHEANKVYEMSYREILPTCDVVLYVLEANCRSYSEDLRVLRDIVIPSCSKIRNKIIIAINKIDLIGESAGIHWNMRINQPPREQRELIMKELDNIKKRFPSELGVSKDQIVYYSALTGYHISDLLLAFINSCPITNPYGFLDYMGMIPDNIPDNNMLQKWNLVNDIFNQSK